MKPRSQLTFRQKLFGAMLHDQVAFMRHFWSDEITLPPSTRQKLLWSDMSRQVLAATGRKVSKTLYLEGRIVRKSLAYRQRTRVSERAFGAPGDQQLKPTLLRLGTKIHANPLFRLLFTMNKNDKTIKCATNVMWHTRIDGTSADDRNWVGLRLDEIIFDEAAFTNYVCHNSRKQSALPHCGWFYAGVPNGVRHTPFWELDQTDLGRNYSRHKVPTYANPLYWSDAERERMKADYEDSPHNYTTQVMGRWGAEVLSSFPPEAIAVRENAVYRIVTIHQHDIPSSFFDYDPVQLTRLYAKLGLAKPVLAENPQYAIGMDYGFHQDPSEIVIAWRDGDSKDWQVMHRITMLGVDPLAQARLIHFVVDALGRDRVGRMCIDLMSGAVAIAIELTRLERFAEYYQQVIMDFAVSSTKDVVDPTDENRVIRVRKKQWATQKLQMALIAARGNLMSADFMLWLGKDDEMIQELQDTRERKNENGTVIYIPRMLGGRRAVDHRTDALRALVTAIQEILDRGATEYADDDYVSEAGWAPNPLRGDDDRVFGGMWSDAFEQAQKLRSGGRF